LIGRLEGRLVDCSPDRVVIDTGGVGYDLQISLQTFYALSGRQGQQAVLVVHTHVREDALVLFGFVEPDERAMFRHLIAVSGVGPKVALAMLSGITPADLRVAVAERDRARLQSIPGVGKKTAERVLLELGDRLSRDARRGSRVDAPVAVDAELSTPRADAISALVNLGYGEEAARKAVDAVLDDADGPPALETLLRGSLRRLVR
jgi:Holliday junction DNA helicase RuvA